MRDLESLTQRLKEVTAERRATLKSLEDSVVKVGKLEMEHDLQSARTTLTYQDVSPMDVRKAKVTIAMQDQAYNLMMAKAEKTGLEKRQEVLGKELDALRSLFSLAKEEARMGNY